MARISKTLMRLSRDAVIIQLPLEFHLTSCTAPLCKCLQYIQPITVRTQVNTLDKTAYGSSSFGTHELRNLKKECV